MRILGAFAIAGMAVLTSFTSQYVINAANKDADDAYKKALDACNINRMNESNESSEALEQTSEIEKDTSKPHEDDPKVQDSDVSDVNTETNSKPEEESKKSVKPNKPYSTSVKPSEPIKEFSEDVKRIKFDNCTLVDGKLVYTVQDGDYLSLIAEKFGCTVDQINNANKIANINLIYTGNKFIVPVTSDVLAYAKTVID